MIVNVYYNYYITKNLKRNKEIDFCLTALISNNSIDNIYVVGEHTIVNKKCKNIYFEGQPTYNYFFALINKHTYSDDINILLNSDCFLDEDAIGLIKKNIKKNQCYCLTRWDIIDESMENIMFYNRMDSQDAWVFKGKLVAMNADFKMGTDGCDNALCYELYKRGYKILNPSLDIVVAHYHLIDDRKGKVYSRVNLKYKFVKPSSL